MRIVINFEKKHLYFLLIFLAVIGVGVVIASNWDGSQSHGTLWTTEIKGKNVSSITVYDDLRIEDSDPMTPDKNLCLNGVCITTLSSTATGWTENAVGNKIYTTNTNRNVGIGTINPTEKLSVVLGSNMISPNIAVDVKGGALNLNGNKLVSVDWAGSLPSSSVIYKNTAGCDETTSNLNAVTLVDSCSRSSSACIGIFRTGFCSRYNNEDIACTAVGCYYIDGGSRAGECTGGMTLNTDCSHYSSTQCDPVGNGCMWTTESNMAYNTPLGRLVNL